MSPEQKNDQRQIVIMGAGLAGLTLALQVHSKVPSARITIIEKQGFPYPDAAHKVGESSVELGAHYFGKVLGLQSYLETHQLKKLGLRFYFRSKSNLGFADRVEVGAGNYWPKPSYQLDRGRFENHLADECRARGIEIFDSARVREIEISDQRHSVQFMRADQVHSIQADWLIDASGRGALLRRKLDLHLEADHKINAVWFRVNSKINIDDWGANPDFKTKPEQGISRWFSTNHLMGPGYWVWVIPLVSGATSIGIVADPRLVPLKDYNSREKALEWLKQNEPECARAIEDSGAEIMDFLALKHFSHRVKQVYFSNRVALTGEAGLFLDPFYSPGSDFISISNTFKSDLIERDFASQAIGLHSTIYNQMYLSFAENTFAVYQDQYPLFGDSRIMTAKLIWDFAVYWVFLAAIYCSGNLCNTNLFIKIRVTLDQLNQLNRSAQQLFRDWHALELGAEDAKYVDLRKYEQLYRLNELLTRERDAAQVEADLKAGLDTLQEIYQEFESRMRSSKIAA